MKRIILAMAMIASAQASAISKCVDENGHVIYKQGICVGNLQPAAPSGSTFSTVSGSGNAAAQLKAMRNLREPRRTSSAQSQAPSGQSGPQPLTYGQRKALRNAEVGRPDYDRRLTPSQNAAVQNAHNAKARGILRGTGLNPDKYVSFRYRGEGAQEYAVR